MDSIIETQRATHEEIERYEQALADVIMQAPTIQRNIARRDRKAADILTRIGELRQNLVLMYEDAPGLRPTEIALLSAPPSGQDDLAEFYSRFEKVKDFHQKNQGINARTFLSEIDELVRSDGLQTIYVEGEDEPVVVDPLDSVFSGEETYGKHLDLYDPHTQYLNLKGANRISYIAYLDMLRRGTVERTLDAKERASAAYLAYVTTLYNYLVSFFDRALPLIDIKDKLRQEEDNFAAAWEAGQVGDWKGEGNTANNGEGIWCPFCQKNYSKQTVYDAHLKSEKHKKKSAAGKAVENPQSGPSTTQKDRLRAPARLTYLVGALLTFPPIPDIIARSRGEVERRMALTARERDAEIEETEEAAPVEVVKIDNGESDEESDDGTIFNPLKLPLGYDGKPIPFWLYKVNSALALMYLYRSLTFAAPRIRDFVLVFYLRGSATYQGRKAFDKHFSEARHALGMRSLGLPNTKHFHEITEIADALALAEKLKYEGRQELAAMDRAVEMEDEAGNVYDKKTYDDLRRQGVI